MGLIKAFAGSAGGVLADQWRDYFCCNALDTDTIAVKGSKRTSARSSNTHGSSNIISNGSIISVADGQCALIVVQGEVEEICAEPGEYLYDTSAEPSIFFGKLDKESILNVLKNIGRRFTFGGQPPMDQRIYYINTKEFTGNPYGTPAPVPFRVVDSNIGLDMDISVGCFGEFSYRITNPLLFYANVCGNVEDAYLRKQLDGQLKSELLTALQPAFAAISQTGIRYSSLPLHTEELSEKLNEILSAKWKNLRGIELSSLGISSIKATEKDEQLIKELQRYAALKDPGLSAAQLVSAQSSALQQAAGNEQAGPAFAFMGMNMAAQAGGAKAQDLFAMAESGKPASSPDTWTCECGNVTSDPFCSRCGRKRPEAKTWKCICGRENDSLFCPSCGRKKPEANGYLCSKCGYHLETEEEMHFCPKCGNPF
jgi:membrane protease subunit (stomatin/prohibitin family)